MVTFQLDKSALNKIEEDLLIVANKMPTVLQKAINETTKKVREQLLTEAKDQYVIQPARFKKVTKIKRATLSKPQGTIKATGKSLELRDYKVTPNRYNVGKERPSILKGQVSKKGSPKDLEVGNTKAFITKFKSGHIAVVQRVPEKRMKSNPQKEFIKKLLSPSIPTMLGNERKVYGKVQPYIRQYLEAYIKKYTDIALGKSSW